MLSFSMNPILFLHSIPFCYRFAITGVIQSLNECTLSHVPTHGLIHALLRFTISDFLSQSYLSFYPISHSLTSTIVNLQLIRFTIVNLQLLTFTIVNLQLLTQIGFGQDYDYGIEHQQVSPGAMHYQHNSGVQD